MAGIHFLVMDVDGTLTDGKVYMGPQGEAMKAFDIKDGYGIKLLLPTKDIIPVVITARQSAMVEHRCKELDVKEIHQGIRNKQDCLISILNRYSIDNNHFSLANCAYIGDDLLDLQCMNPIKEQGGIVGCPIDAVDSVKRIADFVSSKKGGDGAVREFIEWILVQNQVGK